MDILAINGSPDPKGNTAHLLQKILGAIPPATARTKLLQAAEIIEASGPPFCHVCGNPCPATCYRDTPLETAFAQMTEADAIILGSPVYFGTMAAPLKALFDKSRKLRAEKALLNTVGAAVTVGAARFGGQETTLRALHDIMLVHGMILIGDGDASSDCGHHGVSAQRPAREDAFAQGRALSLARRVATVAQATQSLRAKTA